MVQTSGVRTLAVRTSAERTSAGGLASGQSSAGRFASVRTSAVAELSSPMSFEDRYTVYVLTRGLHANVAMETGVAHGVSSAYILAALRAAGRGRLISIELLEDARVGGAVPADLLSRWSLWKGDSARLLPALLAEAAPVDLFVHDSRHTYRHMRREFELVWPHLASGGLLCSHDILVNNAYARFIRAHRGEIDGHAEGVNFGVIKKA